MKRAGARSGDLQRRIVGIAPDSEPQRKLTVPLAEGMDRGALAIARFLAPDERDFDLCARRAAENNASRVGLAFANRDSRLAEAMRLPGFELDQRRVISGIRRSGVHCDDTFTADGSPPSRGLAIESRIASSIADHRRRRRRTGERERKWIG